MANYRNPETGQEFNSGNLAFGLTTTFFFLFILSGAVAAIPAAFGLITTAVVVWLFGVLVAGYGTGAAYVHIRKNMRIDD